MKIDREGTELRCQILVQQRPFLIIAFDVDRKQYVAKIAIPEGKGKSTVFVLPSSKPKFRNGAAGQQIEIPIRGSSSQSLIV